jgi:hypothetical protein
VVEVEVVELCCGSGWDGLDVMKCTIQRDLCTTSKHVISQVTTVACKQVHTVHTYVHSLVDLSSNSKALPHFANLNRLLGTN